MMLAFHSMVQVAVCIVIHAQRRQLIVAIWLLGESCLNLLTLSCEAFRVNLTLQPL